MFTNHQKSRMVLVLFSLIVWSFIAVVISSVIYMHMYNTNVQGSEYFLQQAKFLTKNIELANIQSMTINFSNLVFATALGLFVFLTTLFTGYTAILAFVVIKNQKTLQDIRDQINFVKLKERHLNKKIMQEKQLREMQINKVLDYSTDCYVRLGYDYKVMHVNTSAKMFFNKITNLAGYKNLLLTDLIPDIKSTTFQHVFNSVTQSQISKTAEIYLHQQKRWLLTRLFYEENAIGVYFSDITAKKESEIGLDSGVSLLKQLLDSSMDAVALVDLNWKFQLSNQKWVRSFGLEEQKLQGKALFDLIPAFAKQLAPLQRDLTRGSNIKIPEFDTLILGKQEWLRFEVKPYRNEDDKISGFILSAIFTTEARKRRKQAEKQRQTERQLAYHDMLTGLPNRQLFHDRLSEALTNSYRNLKKTALLFIDLDGFKAVNDTLGHDVGDRLLQDVAQRLTDATRSSDTVARMGGDEFTIILTNIDEVSDVANIGAKLIKIIGEPYDYGEGIVARVTGSIGIAMYPKDGANSVDLIKHADESMYKAKNSGKNNYVFYESQDFDINAEQFTAEDLEAALSNNELLLHYQGYFDSEKQKVYGVEGLLRWNHPNYGLLRAGQFISVIEQEDTIVRVGGFLLRKACEQLQNWEKEGQKGLLLTLNISPREFLDSTFVKRVEKAVKDFDIKPNSLGFEISEKIIMKDQATTSKTLKQLKALGIVIIVEDVDKEGLSMTILRENPIDMLKISHDYISKIGKDAESENAIKKFVKLARTIGVEPAADCVETPDQEKFLIENGCFKMQGYLFGRPSKPTKHFVITQKS